MPKSLADLRASEHVGRPETEFPLCVAGKLNAEFDRIDLELDELLSDPSTRRPAGEGDDSDVGPVRRVGQKGVDPRITQLNARREELRTLMADHTVLLHLRAREDGAWRTWKTANPPRDGDKGDERAGFNLDALIDDLRDNPRHWIIAINGEPYGDDDWAFIWANASDGDQWRLAALARSLHTTGVDVPKSLTDWLATRKSATSSS